MHSSGVVNIPRSSSSQSLSQNNLAAEKSTTLKRSQSCPNMEALPHSFNKPILPFNPKTIEQKKTTTPAVVSDNSSVMQGLHIDREVAPDRNTTPSTSSRPRITFYWLRDCVMGAQNNTQDSVLSASARHRELQSEFRQDSDNVRGRNVSRDQGNDCAYVTCCLLTVPAVDGALGSLSTMAGGRILSDTTNVLTLGRVGGLGGLITAGIGTGCYLASTGFQAPEYRENPLNDCVPMFIGSCVTQPLANMASNLILGNQLTVGQAALAGMASPVCITGVVVAGVICGLSRGGSL